MVPEVPTDRALDSLSAKDKEQFSNLQFFNFDAVRSLSLSDLILEISHFYDESVITRVC